MSNPLKRLGSRETGSKIYINRAKEKHLAYSLESKRERRGLPVMVIELLLWSDVGVVLAWCGLPVMVIAVNVVWCLVGRWCG